MFYEQINAYKKEELCQTGTKYKEEYVTSDHLLYVQLGDNIRKLRKQCYLTQDELAERLAIRPE